MTIKTYSPQGVASFLGVSKKTIYRAIKNGELAAIKYNPRVIKITATDCAAWYALKGGKLKMSTSGTNGIHSRDG